MIPVRIGTLMPDMSLPMIAERLRYCCMLSAIQRPSDAGVRGTVVRSMLNLFSASYTDHAESRSSKTLDVRLGRHHTRS